MAVLAEPTATRDINAGSPFSPAENPTDAANQDELPFFMTRPVTEDDLRGKSDWELDIMRNEIYARYGRRFNRQDLQSYFNQQPWYVPKYDPDKFDPSLLTPTQCQNATFIRRYQGKGDAASC